MNPEEFRSYEQFRRKKLGSEYQKMKALISKLTMELREEEPLVVTKDQLWDLETSLEILYHGLYGGFPVPKK